MVLSLLLPIVYRLSKVHLELPSYPLSTQEELQYDVHIWLVILSEQNKDQICFCCITLRNVIFAEWYFAHVMLTRLGYYNI
jgi:hypothetical protein